MVEYLKNINWKHVLIMCIGNILAGMGIAIFMLLVWEQIRSVG